MRHDSHISGPGPPSVDRQAAGQGEAQAPLPGGSRPHSPLPSPLYTLMSQVSRTPASPSPSPRPAPTFAPRRSPSPSQESLFWWHAIPVEWPYGYKPWITFSGPVRADKAAAYLDDHTLQIGRNYARCGSRRPAPRPPGPAAAPVAAS